MLDRTQAPKITTDFNLKIENVTSFQLSNQLEVYEVNTGTQDIIKIELIFKSGRVNEEKIAAARATLQVIGEGTKSKSASEIAEVFDFYGAEVKFKSALESSSISLVCLTRHFKNVWPQFCDILFNPIFDEKEIKKYTDVSSQKLKNQITKNDVISYRVLTEKIFGADHPYGYNTEPEHFTALEQHDLINYYSRNLSLKNAFLVLSGKYDKSIRDEILTSLDVTLTEKNPYEQKFFTNTPPYETLKENTKNDSQVSIKMGRLLFDRQDPDFSKMFFLNTLFGGYFGSRLMKNIREEKGYTYGIYSSLDAYKQGGIFYISSDVSNNHMDPCIDEIYKEMDVLKSDLVNAAELDMVRNFILGQSLHLIDGPFATAHLIKNIVVKELEIKDFEKHINTIKEMSASDVLDTANKYFEKNLFTSVIAGSFVVK